MQALEERIRIECSCLGRNVLKVDSFLNHQIDPDLMLEIGRELARRFGPVEPNKILTVEVGGIGPAFGVGAALHIPVVVARKHRFTGMPIHPLQESTLSKSADHMVSLYASPEFLVPGDRVLIVDDFLTSAQTILALARMARAGGAQVVGVGAVIEKTFDHGRSALQALNVPVESVISIESMNGDKIVFSSGAAE
jgi:xanthine phosphoribosyltransferase